MSNKHSFERKQSFQYRKLNTKGCCFLCLRLVDFKTEDNKQSKREPVTLKHLRRYLQINSKGIYGSEEDITLDLCESCTKITDKFKSCFSALEAIQLELNYWLKRIHQEITEASKKPELVQNYSKRMTSDPESLAQLLFVDNLRKEIAKKSSKRKPFTELKVDLLKLKNIERYSVNRKETEKLQLQSPSSQIDDDQSEDGFIPVEDHYEDAINQESETYNKLANSNACATSSSFTSRYETERLVKNSKTGTFDCRLCSKPSNTAETARMHYESVHLKKKYKCDLCGGNYISIYLLKVHKRNHHGILAPSSSRRQNISVFNHLTNKYNCVVCKKEFLSQSSAYYHFNNLHATTKFNCDYCKKGLPSKSYLKLHQTVCTNARRRIENNKLKQMDSNYRFSCPECSKMFKWQASMQLHVENVHLKKRKYACDLCQKRFQSMGDMRKHKNAVHFGRQFNCKNCKKQFKWKTSAQLHERKCLAKAIKSEAGPGKERVASYDNESSSFVDEKVFSNK